MYAFHSAVPFLLQSSSVVIHKEEDSASATEAAIWPHCFKLPKETGQQEIRSQIAVGGSHMYAGLHFSVERVGFPFATLIDMCSIRS